jgi:hypothetical protein
MNTLHRRTGRTSSIARSLGWLLSLSLALWALFGAGPGSVVAGTATVDGRVTPSDGYSKYADIYSGAVKVATVWWTRDASYVYFALELTALAPTGVVNENVYGPEAYHATFETGWPRNRHTFDQLLKSDRARFQIACGGEVKDDFIQDYLYEITEGTGKNKVVVGYGSGTAGEGAVFVGGPVAASSSMVWNSTIGWGLYTTQSPDFDPKYPTPAASTPSNWVWPMVYEFKLDGSKYVDCPITFAMPAFDGATPEVGGMHNSPAKSGSGSVIVTPIPEPTPTPTPEVTATPEPTPTGDAGADGDAGAHPDGDPGADADGDPASRRRPRPRSRRRRRSRPRRRPRSRPRRRSRAEPDRRASAEPTPTATPAERRAERRAERGAQRRAERRAQRRAERRAEPSAHPDADPDRRGPRRHRHPAGHAAGDKYGDRRVGAQLHGLAARPPRPRRGHRADPRPDPGHRPTPRPLGPSLSPSLRPSRPPRLGLIVSGSSSGPGS